MSEIEPQRTRIFQLTEGGGASLPRFQDCPLDKVPQDALDQVGYEAITHQEVTQSRQLHEPWVADFGKGGKVYVLAYHQIKQLEGYPTRDYGIYAVDISNSGEFMGMGVSLLDLDDNDQERSEAPYVHWTGTNEEFKRLGLGLRRLIILNKANKLLFKRHLSSGSFSAADSPAPINTWERLVEAGLAVKDEEGAYRFIK